VTTSEPDSGSILVLLCSFLRVPSMHVSPLCGEMRHVPPGRIVGLL
jgi:hypothetical protein